MRFVDKFKYCPSCGSCHFEENDFKSKRCAECGFTYFFNAAAAVVSIITNERGEMLVCRRACEPARGTLDLVGGFVDPSGETLEEAMVREIKEETGLDIQTTQLRYLFSLPNTYLYSDLTVHTIDAFFYVEVDSSSVITPHDDVAECWWLSPDNLNPADIGLDSIRNGVVKYLGS
jgi:NADH pyrophosphatase NudC (nudix superfamily)